MYGHLRFKKLKNQGFGGYPPFDIDETLIDEVDLDTFIKKEETRIPLFIGHQFGINPWFNNIPNFLFEDKIVAILGKSVLSGHVAGLSIYQIPANSPENEWIKLIFFKNEVMPIDRNKY
jgi:hypothetical protein